MAAKFIILVNILSHGESVNVSLQERRRTLATDITNLLLDHEFFLYLINAGSDQEVIKFINTALAKYYELQNHPEYVQHKNNVDRIIAKLQWQRDQY